MKRLSPLLCLFDPALGLQPSLRRRAGTGDTTAVDAHADRCRPPAGLDGDPGLGGPTDGSPDIAAGRCTHRNTGRSRSRHFG